MNVKVGASLSWVLDDVPPSSEDLMWEHAMDISASVFTRMTELGMTQKELAEKMNMDQAQLSRIIRGDANLTIKTLARLESALNFDLASGFKYRPQEQTVSYIYSEVCTSDEKTEESILFNIPPSRSISEERIAA